MFSGIFIRKFPLYHRGHNYYKKPLNIFLETIHFVIFTKTLCIQLKQTRKRPQKYTQNNCCFRELFFCNNFGQDGIRVHAQYDWTTGVPDNGNEWRKFRAVPRPYPLRSLVCTLFTKGGSREAFRLRGAGGDHFHYTVEPSPGHFFGVDRGWGKAGQSVISPSFFGRSRDCRQRGADA